MLQQKLIDSIRTLTTSNVDIVASPGARTIALNQFAAAALATLTPAQCAQMALLFRDGVEQAMAHTDDTPLPQPYHDALLDEVNILLAALEAVQLQGR